MRLGWPPPSMSRILRSRDQVGKMAARRRSPAGRWLPRGFRTCRSYAAVYEIRRCPRCPRRPRIFFSIRSSSLGGRPLHASSMLPRPRLNPILRRIVTNLTCRTPSRLLRAMSSCRFAPSPPARSTSGASSPRSSATSSLATDGGTFVLRIEEHGPRTLARGVYARHPEGLGWLGLTWDEGPYSQSERLSLYRARARRCSPPEPSIAAGVTPRARGAPAGRARRGPSSRLRPHCPCAPRLPPTAPPTLFRFRLPSRGKPSSTL